MTAKKIFMVIPTLGCGGAERIILQIAGALRAKNRQPIVYTFVPGNFYKVPVSQRELPAVRPGPFQSLRKFLCQSITLTRAISREKPSAVLSFSPVANLPTILAVLLSGRISKTRLIVSERSMPSNAYTREIAARRRILACILVKLLYPFADIILFNSQGASREFQSWFGMKSKHRVLKNPLPIKNIKKQARKKPAHQWARSTTPFFLSLGRLIPDKDCSSLLNAFALIRKKHRFRLIVIGGGSEKQNLEKTADELGIAKDVAFLGFEPNPYPYLARCTALIHTSRTDSSPNAILEAIALGRPVIATDCPCGPREILQNCSGILVPIGDARAIADAATKITSSSKEYQRLSTAAQKRANEYDAERILPEYISLLT